MKIPKTMPFARLRRLAGAHRWAPVHVSSDCDHGITVEQGSRGGQRVVVGANYLFDVIGSAYGWGHTRPKVFGIVRVANPHPEMCLAEVRADGTFDRKINAYTSGCGGTYPTVRYTVIDSTPRPMPAARAALAAFQR